MSFKENLKKKMLIDTLSRTVSESYTDRLRGLGRLIKKPCGGFFR